MSKSVKTNLSIFWLSISSAGWLWPSESPMEFSKPQLNSFSSFLTFCLMEKVPFALLLFLFEQLVKWTGEFEFKSLELLGLPLGKLFDFDEFLLLAEDFPFCLLLDFLLLQNSLQMFGLLILPGFDEGSQVSPVFENFRRVLDLWMRLALNFYLVRLKLLSLFFEMLVFDFLEGLLGLWYFLVPENLKLFKLLLALSPGLDDLG